jgi:5-methylcytosine-specific restriction protein B
MSKYDDKFSWVKTHKEIVEYLKDKQDKQKELIKLLKDVGIKHFSDEPTKGKKVEMQEIDPFTFFCYIYKHGDVKRLEFLKKIAKELKVSIPYDTYGVPSVNAQMVWMFPYKYDRNNNEIENLWNFFHSALEENITDDQFQSILNIQNVGNTKITEALFLIEPNIYFPLNYPSKVFLRNYLGINPEYSNFSEYMNILKQIRDNDQRPFYELSYEAWLWNNQNNNNYWIFQGNPKYYDFERAFREIEIDDWTVSSYKYDIKVGDKVIIWLTGEQRGVYALAEVTSEPKEKVGGNDEEYWKTNERPNIKAGIKITRNLIENPILKSEIEKVAELSNLKVGKQGTNFKATKEEFQAIMKLINTSKPQEDKINYPLNLIFYGPPGTGKTYHSILRAAEIIEGRTIADYNEGKKIFNDNLGKRIEFITFHQNYSYEDFIQGLRPDTENNNHLIFDRKDGIFKKIADRAMENLKLSEKEPEQVSDELRFDEALDKFKEEIQESNDKFKINNVAYIYEVDDEAFRYTGESWSYSNGIRMKFSDLKEFYRKNVQSRKDIKELRDVSGLAKQHATYYFLVYQMILKMLPKEKKTNERIDLKNYVIVIDEINRANISRVFGELITLIEPDKRYGGAIPLKAKLPSGEDFEVPSNLYIIGTMNTADKSIALLDIALRRRFVFEAMYPLYDIEGHTIYDKEILKKINEKIIQLKGHDFQIGHSFFMDKGTDLKERMNKKVIPLLMEYFMNDVNEVIDILQSAGLEVDKEKYPLKVK